MAIVAEAATGQAAIREAVLHRPDVVVMDLQMPELNGIETTRELARAVPTAAVLVLTMFDDDDDSVFAAMRAGARGYVLKGVEQQEIARAIMAVAAREAIFGPAVATRVLVPRISGCHCALFALSASVSVSGFRPSGVRTPVSGVRHVSGVRASGVRASSVRCPVSASGVRCERPASVSNFSARVNSWSAWVRQAATRLGTSWVEQLLDRGSLTPE